MTTRVAFLRAVNLGKRKVPMERLAEITRGLGFDEVWTHINSGNVVFGATGARADLEGTFEDALEDRFGFEVTTFIRSAAEVRKSLALDPFKVADGDTYFLTFLKKVPTKKQQADLEALSGDFDTIVVSGRDVHWRMHGKSTDTLLPTKAWEQVIGHHTSTSRNVNMLRKLLDKIESRP